MASDKRTAFLMAYKEAITFIPFLSTFFRTNASDIVEAESVKIDIMRGTRKIAPVISNLSAIGGKIKKSIYTGKEYTPPVVAVSADFAPGDLVNKAFGLDEYASAKESYMMQLQSKVMDAMIEIEKQFGMNIEYQASQILQTGTLSLYDDQGNIAYTISFLPKATHFPTVSTSWNDETSDPDADITNLYDVIKKDAKVNAKNIIFGKTALENYLKNTKTIDKFDVTRINSGTFDPNEINGDVNYLGRLLIGAKRFECWVYEGMYDHPSTGTITKFVDDDKVILLPDAGSINFDLRKVWCKVPTITGVDPRFASVMPSSLNLDDRAYTARVWVEGSADTLNVELKAWPLCIPVSIDAFGCIDTQI